MSSLQYRKQCCQQERARDHQQKQCVRSPHRYLTQLSDHEKFVENMSNLSLRQAPCRTSREPRRQRTSPNPTNTTSKNEGGSQLCYPLQRRPTSSARCRQPFAWQTGKYVRDECGSGIVPTRLEATDPRRLWCKTPLTMYQSTIGELARQMLCREITVPKRVNDGPPCNLCERVMPMCKGYYRKYECRRKCEEEHATMKNGRKVYRDAIQQYWMPCLTTEEKRAYDLAKDADHNVYLGKKLKRKIDDRLACW